MGQQATPSICDTRQLNCYLQLRTPPWIKILVTLAGSGGPQTATPSCFHFKEAFQGVLLQGSPLCFTLCLPSSSNIRVGWLSDGLRLVSSSSRQAPGLMARRALSPFALMPRPAPHSLKSLVESNTCIPTGCLSSPWQEKADIAVRSCAHLNLDARDGSLQGKGCCQATCIAALLDQTGCTT